MDATTTTTKTADEAIGLFLEYRDQHGHSEESARAMVAQEFTEAAVTDIHVPREPLEPDWRWPWVRGCEYIWQEGTSFWEELRIAAGLSREAVYELTIDQGGPNPADQAQIEGDHGAGFLYDLEHLNALAHLYKRSPGELLDASYDKKGCELLAESLSGEDEEAPPAITIICRDRLGETKIRRVTPLRVRYGTSEFHTEPQFLLEVFDHTIRAMRIYALTECVAQSVSAQVIEDGR